MSICEIDCVVCCSDVEAGYIRSCVFQYARSSRDYALTTIRVTIAHYLRWRTRGWKAYRDFGAKQNQAFLVSPSRNYVRRVMALVSSVVSDRATYKARRYENAFHVFELPKLTRIPKRLCVCGCQQELLVDRLSHLSRKRSECPLCPAFLPLDEPPTGCNAAGPV